jgi:hypothetical protein
MSRGQGKKGFSCELINAFDMDRDRMQRHAYEGAFVPSVPQKRLDWQPEWSHIMSTITGVVTNGVVIPNTPLPEGARVEIQLQPNRPEVPPELQEEFDGWDRAGAGTIEMVERLAEGRGGHN